MTKTERMIYLVNVIKNREGITIKEMAAETGVSGRSIYRDLKLMGKLDIPLYSQDGYRLVRDTNVPFMDVSQDDLELIRYALRRNPLFGHPFFNAKFIEIEQKISERRIARGARGVKDIFVMGKGGRRPVQDRKNDLLARFLMGIYENRKVQIRVGGRGKTLTQYVPVAVKLTDASPALVVTKEKKKAAIEILLSDVTDIKLTADKFVRRPAGRTK